MTTDSSIALNVSKTKLIKQQLNKIHKLYKENLKQYKKTKRMNMFLKLSINILNAVTISSLVITYTGFQMMIVSLSASSISSIINVINESMSFHERSLTYQTTYLQTYDLYNVYNNKMLIKNSNYDEILTQLNEKIGIILDSAQTISISSSDEFV